MSYLPNKENLIFDANKLCTYNKIDQPMKLYTKSIQIKYNILQNFQMREKYSPLPLILRNSSHKYHFLSSYIVTLILH